MEGMISMEAVEIQQKAYMEADSPLRMEAWAQELVTKLLKITHGQWLNLNVNTHDVAAMDVASKWKEELWHALRTNWNQERRVLSSWTIIF